MLVHFCLRATDHSLELQERRTNLFIHLINLICNSSCHGVSFQPRLSTKAGNTPQNVCQMCTGISISSLKDHILLPTKKTSLFLLQGGGANSKRAVIIPAQECRTNLFHIGICFRRDLHGGGGDPAGIYNSPFFPTTLSISLFQSCRNGLSFLDKWAEYT